MSAKSVQQPDIEITPATAVSRLPLVSATLTKAFKTAKVSTVEDLLYYFPTRYMDYRKTAAIGSVAEGETVTVVGRIKSVRSSFGFRGRRPYAEIVLEDGTGKIHAVWFNQSYIAKQLETGMEIILSGKVSRYKQLQFTNPTYDVIDPNTAAESLHTGRLVPIYRRTDLLPLRTLRRIIRAVLPAAKLLDDFIPAKLAKTYQVLPAAEAVRILHFPDNETEIQTAQFRIAVDDILPQQLAVELRKHLEAGKAGHQVKADLEKVKLFIKSLPFTLTPGQKRAAWDIFQDFESGQPMNRLLQGDVGSGKTIVAALAALPIMDSGLQTALLAPTEILAKQHYETFLELFGKSNGPTFTVALLTRTFTLINGREADKKDLAAKIADGEIDLCIGTHALLQGKTGFKNLGLVIIDEQHRFGVSQRSFLLAEEAGNKSVKQRSQPSAVPHLLSMSATPIPRTLAMSLYADLSVSTLSHIPGGRPPVVTEVLPEARRQVAYDYIKQEAAGGRQAFVVTPRVEDTEASEVRSVKKEFNRLQTEVFPELRLGLLYGKMKGAEKDKIMAAFAAGKLDVLVATSVIEIGIDIPKATAIIIEGAERFGLAQLHQLRGRVGRSELPSRCYLFTTEASHQDTQRLNMLTKTNDGFALAEFDLQQRGFGDLFGKQQSGFLFRFPQFITVKALKTARELAEQIYQSPDFQPKHPLHQQAMEYLQDIHGE